MILKLSTESPSQWNHTFGGEIEDLLKVGHLVSTRIRVEEGTYRLGMFRIMTTVRFSFPE